MVELRGWDGKCQQEDRSGFAGHYSLRESCLHEPALTLSLALQLLYICNDS